MSHEVFQLLRQALYLALLISAPPIIAASAVGLLVAVFQSATQLQDQTLQYAAKLLAMVITIVAFAGGLSAMLVAFATRVFDLVPVIVRP